MLNTIYERSGGLNRLNKNGIALGKITHVDAKTRFCEVKTFFGEPGLIDLHLPKVQWLSTDSNPAGDESTSIPRVGSTGLVFFVGGTAFIWGYFKATSPAKGAVTGKEVADLKEGDKIIATVGGNRIIVRANASIEIQSTDTLRTIYFPKDGLLADICEAYTFKGDGGTESWKIINEANQTLYKRETRMDLARTNLVYEEMGAVDGATVIKRTTIGPGIPGIEGIQLPVFKFEQDITGKTTCEVGLAGTGLSIEMTPLGDFTMKNLLSQVNLAASGDWEFKTPAGTFKMSTAGDAEFTNTASGKLSVTATGDVEASNPKGKYTMSATGDMEISNNGVEITGTATGDVTAKSKIGQGTLMMEKTGAVTLKGAIGVLKIDKDGKIGLGGPAAELLDLLDQLLDAFIKQPNLTMTGVGPSGPLNPPAMMLLTQIKVSLNIIKGSV